ncbi:MAG: hypothetical protein WDW36_010361, partial [Sanguina aurantia]
PQPTQLTAARPRTDRHACHQPCRLRHAKHSTPSNSAAAPPPPVRASPSPSGSPPPGDPAAAATDEDEDPDSDLLWERFGPAEDNDPNWYKEDFIPATVGAVLSVCPEPHKRLLGTGPANTWRLPMDHWDPYDPRNAGEVASDWVVLDQHALRRFNRRRFGPKPPPLPKGCGFQLRNVPRTVRWVGYKLAEAPEDWYREQLMLHTRWRHEDELLHGCASYQERYLQVVDTVQRRAADITKMSDEDVEEARARAERYMAMDETEARAEADRMEAAFQREDDRDEDGEQRHTYTEGLEHPDLQHGRDRAPTMDVAFDVHSRLLPDDEYRAGVRMMQPHQRAIYDNVGNIVTTQSVGSRCRPNAPEKGPNTTLQIIQFVTGGAGVGKSLTLTNIVQMLLRHYRWAISAHSPEDATDIANGAVTVVVMACTGSAAYNVHGQTLHSCLGVRRG